MDFFTPAQIAYMRDRTVRVCPLAVFEFVSETVHAWNGNYPLPSNGNTYQPMKGIGSFDGLGMSAGGVSDYVTVALNGLPDGDPNFLSLALASNAEVIQQPLNIYLQLFDTDWQIPGSGIGVPIFLFSGFMQPPKVTRSAMQDGEGSIQSISVTAENVFYNRAKPANGRNTDRDQQARSPGDKFFGFVASLLAKQVKYPDHGG